MRSLSINRRGPQPRAPIGVIANLYQRMRKGSKRSFGTIRLFFGRRCVAPMNTIVYAPKHALSQNVYQFPVRLNFYPLVERSMTLQRCVELRWLSSDRSMQRSAPFSRVSDPQKSHVSQTLEEQAMPRRRLTIPLQDLSIGNHARKQLSRRHMNLQATFKIANAPKPIAKVQNLRIGQRRANQDAEVQGRYLRRSETSAEHNIIASPAKDLSSGYLLKTQAPNRRRRPDMRIAARLISDRPPTSGESMHKPPASYSPVTRRLAKPRQIREGDAVVASEQTFNSNGAPATSTAVSRNAREIPPALTQNSTMPPPARPINVRQLADEVMREISTRLRVERERRGRF